MTTIAKRTNLLLYERIPDIVAAQPHSQPEALARLLTNELTDSECREILTVLVSQRCRVAQQVRAHHA